MFFFLLVLLRIRLRRKQRSVAIHHMNSSRPPSHTPITGQNRLTGDDDDTAHSVMGCRRGRQVVSDSKIDLRTTRKTTRKWRCVRVQYQILSSFLWETFATKISPFTATATNSLTILLSPIKVGHVMQILKEKFLEYTWIYLRHWFGCLLISLKCSCI